MKPIYINNLYKKAFLLMLMLCPIVSCKKLIDADLPTDSVKATQAFSNDNAATSSVMGVYALMNTDNTPINFANGGLGVLGGLYSDELNSFTGSYSDYATSKVLSDFDPGFWSRGYSTIFKANACINGILASSGMSASAKSQLLGESYFLRAFCYFNMVNMYGDVPLVLTTDYLANSSVPRVPKANVYDQIVADLTESEKNLSATYVTTERVRVNKLAASALLARVYLYMKNYTAAETKATEVIGNAQYSLVNNPANAFLKGSTEAIWQLMPVLVTNPYNDAMDAYFYLPTIFNRPSYTITDDLFNSFEASDLRKTNWIGQYTYLGKIYNYPAKYKAAGVTPAPEYMIVLRLAEQFLIRAEARAQLNNLSGSQDDLNVIRKRAGLGNTPATTIADIIPAIARERRVELFAEYAHRWFDLSRTGRMDAVISALKPTTWKSTGTVWPIPKNEILLNPAMIQNAGY